MNAREYLQRIRPAAQRSSLAPFHADLIELRQAGCTLAQIVEFLRLNNLSISFSAVGRYLRKHASATPPASSAASTRPPALPVASASATPPDSPARETPSVDNIKTREQLRAEHPTMPMIQLSKLYAQQFGEQTLTAEAIDDLKRKFPHLTKPTA